MIGPLKRLALCLVLTGLCIGCVTTDAILLTPQIIAQRGSRVFRAPVEKVFAATINTLRIEGYDIVVAEPAKGLIVTNRRLVGMQAQVAGNLISSIPKSRQLIAYVGTKGDAVQVTIEPHNFEGDRDVIFEAPYFSQEYLDAFWAGLFNSIQRLL